jgi:hypothetical protein
MTRPERVEDLWRGHFVHRLRCLRKTYLPLIQSGRIFKSVPGVKTGLKPQAKSYRPFGAESA